ncbi:sulfatase [Hymenobacter sp. RP-2-7]|uniref:Sulfatase n=1 Tax=Hymenobacter polaris TaxID=2682546 RepID=A0A7Y0FMS8_9BACT|nr:sulfatase [Hymenobacter polaris]NML65836.1 sulfatase [Hymenobacter polaris]
MRYFVSYAWPRWLSVGVASLLLAGLGLAARPAPPRLARPNIILINMDDMGYGDTEPYGMTGVPTPNFNRLAREGTRFTHFNAGQPVCTASRAALLTGCYPNRVGMEGVLLPWDTRALNPQEATLAAQLRRAGYHTAMLGKWHLGNRAPYLPIHYGFDSFYGLPWSNDIWPIDRDGFSRVTDPKDMRSRFPVLTLLEGDTPVDTIRNLNDQATLTTRYTERAVRYIRAHRAGQPFFLYLAHAMPHVPLAASARFKGKSPLGTFGDVLMELDWSLGEILNALDASKLAGNTLLVVTSDNGPWLTYGDHAGSSGGLREGKQVSFEGGVRVPCLIRWPGHAAAGGISSELLTNMDLLPTLLAAAGAPLPERKIDGVSFLPYLEGKTARGPREVFYYYYDGNALQAVRYQRWKLVLPHLGGTYAQTPPGRGGTPGQKPTVSVPQALYDLAHDPAEAYDVQTLYPDVVRQLQHLAEQARADLGDDLTHQSGAGRRPPATY